MVVFLCANRKGTAHGALLHTHGMSGLPSIRANVYSPCLAAQYPPAFQLFSTGYRRKPRVHKPTCLWPMLLDNPQDILKRPSLLQRRARVIQQQQRPLGAMRGRLSRTLQALRLTLC